jgi:hypothetical protein
VTEATEAPLTEFSPDEPLLGEKADAAVAAFRRQLEGHVSVPASVVQDGLLDLWGVLPEGGGRTVVERWLTETLERSLYSVSDVDSRLDAVLASEA